MTRRWIRKRLALKTTLLAQICSTHRNNSARMPLQCSWGQSPSSPTVSCPEQRVIPAPLERSSSADSRSSPSWSAAGAPGAHSNPGRRFRRHRTAVSGCSPSDPPAPRSFLRGSRIILECCNILFALYLCFNHCFFRKGKSLKPNHLFSKLPCNHSWRLS